jgi:predicted dehydrogenase
MRLRSRWKASVCCARERTVVSGWAGASCSSTAHVDTARRDTDLLHAAYAGELAAFVEAARTGGLSPVPGAAARSALAIALAAIESAETGAAVIL